MSPIEKIAFYLDQYKEQVIFSVIFLTVISFIGLFLVLRRSSLFGLVLSSCTQFSFILGMIFHFQSHDSAYHIINTLKPEELTKDLLHMDLYIFPIAFLVTFPFILLMSKGMLNKESLMASLLIFFIGLIPLTNAIAGGSELLLLKLYFSEILYTPVEMFYHYFPFLMIALLLYIILLKKFIISDYDPMLATIQGVRIEWYNILCYFISGYIIALGVRVMGIYVTMSALIVPAVLALSFFNSLKFVMLGTVIFTITFSISGFLISFTFDKLPAEPTLIVFFGTAAIAFWGIKKIMDIMKVIQVGKHEFN